MYDELLKLKHGKAKRRGRSPINLPTDKKYLLDALLRLFFIFLFFFFFFEVKNSFFSQQIIPLDDFFHI